MTKSWHEMTPAERLADRIAKNRAMEERVSQVKTASRKTAEKKPSLISDRQKAVRSKLDEFQRIKQKDGIDAAAEFVRQAKE